MQSDPQLIPVGVLFTVPEPVPALATVMVKRPAGAELKVAVTDRAAVMETTHEPEPVHAPDHPAKVDPASGVAVNVTEEPDLNVSLQSVPQAIPAGELVTVPEPVPDLATVSGKDSKMTAVALAVSDPPASSLTVTMTV